MGNYKFRLSDMIPNAWFYKLKDMNTVVKKYLKTTKIYQSSAAAPNHPHIPKITNQPLLSDQRKSYHFTRDLADNLQPNSPIRKTLIDKKFPVQPPRKSSRRSTKRNRHKNRFVSSPISAGCSCRTRIGSVFTKLPEYSTLEEYSNSLSPDQTSSSELDSVFNEHGSERIITPDTFEEMLYWSTNCKCSVQKDIVIELDNNISNELHDSVPELTPIVTKTQPTNVQRTSTEFSVSNQSYKQSNLIVKDNVTLSTTAKTQQRYLGNSSSPGLKLRMNSPRIAIQGGRKSVSSSNSSLGSWRRRNSVSERSYAAVVKSSKNPRKDFRESMVEMIVENNIRASKDLEELLACYLSLNSDEYHDLIINVFKQIWFHFVRSY